MPMPTLNHSAVLLQPLLKGRVESKKFHGLQTLKIGRFEGNDGERTLLAYRLVELRHHNPPYTLDEGDEEGWHVDILSCQYIECNSRICTVEQKVCRSLERRRCFVPNGATCRE